MDVNRNVVVNYALTFALSFSMVALGSGGDSADDCQSIYADASRMNEVKVSRREWEAGQIASPSAIRSATASGLLMESVGQPVIDCSDATYRCLRSWTHTLAVPRDGLRLHSRYQKDHVIFVVEDCLRVDGSTCATAVVSARCTVLNPKGSCSPGKAGDAGGSKFENVDYFVYSQDFGITAFGSTDRLRVTKDERFAIASQMVLISDIGMLALKSSCARK